ncbi:MAG TPA: hypothetical protein VMF06_16405 [Candidatus Limnocylindria bacterium]|nr:hypothetical protein [Candidatus Limnocylindria bacterium]
MTGKQTIGMTETLRPHVASISREMCPPEWRSLKQAPEDEIHARFENFKEMIEFSEKNFKEHVYDNHEAGQYDFMQHRYVICYLMSVGEKLAMDAFRLEQDQVRDAMLTKVEATLRPLRLIFFQWHGPIEAQTDLPESLKTGMLQGMAGEDFPTTFRDL